MDPSNNADDDYFGYILGRASGAGNRGGRDGARHPRGRHGHRVDPDGSPRSRGFPQNPFPDLLLGQNDVDSTPESTQRRHDPTVNARMDHPQLGFPQSSTDNTVRPRFDTRNVTTSPEFGPGGGRDSSGSQDFVRDMQALNLFLGQAVTQAQPQLQNSQASSATQSSSASQPSSATETSSTQAPPRARSTTPGDDWELVAAADHCATSDADHKGQVPPGIVAHLCWEAHSKTWVMESIGSRTLNERAVPAAGHVHLYFRKLRRYKYDPDTNTIFRMRHDGEEWTYQSHIKAPLSVVSCDDRAFEILERIRNDIRVHVCEDENWVMVPGQGRRISDTYRYPDSSEAIMRVVSLATA